jgi:hypothetical protein
MNFIAKSFAEKFLQKHGVFEFVKKYGFKTLKKSFGKYIEKIESKNLYSIKLRPTSAVGSGKGIFTEEGECKLSPKEFGIESCIIAVKEKSLVVAGAHVKENCSVKSYGVVDNEGEFIIPLGTYFDFFRGVKEDGYVILSDLPNGKYEKNVVMIDHDGTVVDMPYSAMWIPQTLKRETFIAIMKNKDGEFDYGLLNNRLEPLSKFNYDYIDYIDLPIEIGFLSVDYYTYVKGHHVGVINMSTGKESEIKNFPKDVEREFVKRYEDKLVSRHKVERPEEKKEKQKKRSSAS